MNTIDRRIGSIAARQHGIARRSQMLECGVSPSSIVRRIASEDLVAVHPNTFAVGHAALHLTMEGKRAAAVLACDGTPALVLTTAAIRRGIWDRRDEHIHVGARSIPRSAPRDVSFHRLHIPDTDVSMVDDIATTHAIRTLLDLRRMMTPYQLARVIDLGRYRQVLDVDEVAHRLEAMKRVPFVGRLHGALELHHNGCAGTRSVTEDVMLAYLLRHFPRPIVNTRGATEIPGYEPDFLWRIHRVILEVDGGGHLLPSIAEADRTRDEELRSLGWRVIRVSAAEVWNDIEAIGNQLAGLLC